MSEVNQQHAKRMADTLGGVFVVLGIVNMSDADRIKLITRGMVESQDAWLAGKPDPIYKRALDAEARIRELEEAVRALGDELRTKRWLLGADPVAAFCDPNKRLAYDDMLNADRIYATIVSENPIARAAVEAGREGR